MTPDEIKASLTTIAKNSIAAGDHGSALDALGKLADMAIPALDDLGAKKPGIRTTEFWLATLCSVVGTVLSFLPGKEWVGGCLLAVAAGTYALSRGLAKQAAVFFLVVGLVGATGCSQPGYVSATALQPATHAVVERHDRLLDAADDATMKKAGLNPDERDSYKTTSALLEKAVDEGVASAGSGSK